MLSLRSRLSSFAKAKMDTIISTAWNSISAQRDVFINHDEIADSPASLPYQGGLPDRSMRSVYAGMVIGVVGLILLVKSFQSRHDEQILGCLFCSGLIGGATTQILMVIYRRRRTLEVQLRRAINNKKLKLVYQPILDLDTKIIVGAEALVRWTNDTGEAIPPDTFIALAEEKDFVGNITRFVMCRAVDELRDLLTSDDFSVTIHITSKDLADAAFLLDMEEFLRLSGISPSSIGLELTERSTVGGRVVNDAIRHLNQAGHKVYIDDFGPGYLNLAYFHCLDAATIKIDRTFTQTVCNDAVTNSVVPEILKRASKLQLSIMVKGIETEDQAEYFRKARPRGILGQGWLFGKPMSATDLHQYILFSRITEPADLDPILNPDRSIGLQNKQPNHIIKLNVSIIDWQ